MEALHHEYARVWQSSVTLYVHLVLRLFLYSSFGAKERAPRLLVYKGTAPFVECQHEGIRRDDNSIKFVKASATLVTTLLNNHHNTTGGPITLFVLRLLMNNSLFPKVSRFQIDISVDPECDIGFYPLPESPPLISYGRVDEGVTEYAELERDTSLNLATETVTSVSQPVSPTYSRSHSFG